MGATVEKAFELLAIGDDGRACRDIPDATIPSPHLERATLSTLLD